MAPPFRPDTPDEGELVPVRSGRRWIVVLIVFVVGLGLGLVLFTRRPAVELRAGNRGTGTTEVAGDGSTTSSSATSTTGTTSPTTTTGKATDVQTVATTGPKPRPTTTAPKTTSPTAPAAPLVPGLYVMGSDGSHPRLLVKGPTAPGDGWWQPRFSPDGTRIAYVSQKVLHLADLQGRDWVVGSGSSPAWSADSKHLAFSGPGDDGTGSDIWVVDTATPTSPRPVRAQGDDGSPSWGPDGRIASASDFGVFVSDAAGGSRTRIFDGTAKGSQVAWSPDGATLFLARGGGHDLFMAPDGTNQRMIVSGDPYFVQLQASQWPTMWSADSRQVLAIGRIGARTGAWLISAADGNAQFVADEVNDARVSPDAARVAGYHPQHGGSTPSRLVSWRTDGSDRREVFRAPQDLTVTGLDWSPDGKSLAVNLASWLPLGGAGHGPNGWAILPTDSGAGCGAPAGPDGYGATTGATGDGVTVRLDVFPCRVKPGERPTITAAVDTPFTMITAAHFDFGDGTSRDMSFPGGCNRNGGSVMVPNPDHTTDDVTAPAGLPTTVTSDNNHDYAQPGRYQVTVALTVVTCSAWDDSGRPGPSHVVTVTLPIERVDHA